MDEHGHAYWLGASSRPVLTRQPGIILKILYLMDFPKNRTQNKKDPATKPGRRAPNAPIQSPRQKENSHPG